MAGMGRCDDGKSWWSATSDDAHARGIRSTRARTSGSTRPCSFARRADPDQMTHDEPEIEADRAWHQERYFRMLAVGRADGCARIAPDVVEMRKRLVRSVRSVLRIRRRPSRPRIIRRLRIHRRPIDLETFDQSRRCPCPARTRLGPDTPRRPGRSGSDCCDTPGSPTISSS